MAPPTEPWEPNRSRFVSRFLARPDGIGFVAETGSTNADLLVAASGGEQGPIALVAGHQSEGRGRQRRAWDDRPGASLLVSYLIRAEPDWAPLLPLVAGVATVEAVRRLSPGGMADTMVAGLKWPNDVVVEPAEPTGPVGKLAGILAESVMVDGRLMVVVGTGVNLAAEQAHPRSIGLATVIGDAVAPPRDEVLGHYLACTETRLRQLEDGDVEALLDDYRAMCLTLGREVRFDSPGGVIEGWAEGVEADGRLLVRDRAGVVHALSAGDVHHLG